MAMANYSHVSIRKIGKLYETTVNNHFFTTFSRTKLDSYYRNKKKLLYFLANKKEKIYNRNCLYYRLIQTNKQTKTNTNENDY